jgi:hypothetical protein
MSVCSRVPVSMIKSELVQRIAEHNPHLYQRDVENIVNAILDEIVAALAAIGLSCVVLAPSRSSIVQPVPGAIHAPERTYRSIRRASRSSRPARKCANG